MTTTAEAEVNVEGEASETKGKRGRTADRDFTKFSDLHKEVADFVNENSGLTAVTPNQVKAVQLLSADFRNTPERKAAAEAKKAQREAEKKEFAGLADEDVKAVKAARRAAENAAKLQAKANEVLARAKQLQSSPDASGEDLAAVVNGAQEGKQRRPGRR